MHIIKVGGETTEGNESFVQRLTRHVHKCNWQKSQSLLNDKDGFAVCWIPSNQADVASWNTANCPFKLLENVKFFAPPYIFWANYLINSPLNWVFDCFSWNSNKAGRCLSFHLRSNQVFPTKFEWRHSSWCFFFCRHDYCQLVLYLPFRPWTHASFYFSCFGFLLTAVLVLFTCEKQIFVFLKPCLKLFRKDKFIYIARYYTHYFSRLFLN